MVFFLKNSFFFFFFFFFFFAAVSSVRYNKSGYCMEDGGPTGWDGMGWARCLDTMGWMDFLLVSSVVACLLVGRRVSGFFSFFLLPRRRLVAGGANEW